MARRSVAQPSAAQAVASSATASEPLPSDPLAVLRRQWKWAAFCQFFSTFGALFNMPDVFIVDIEQDLTNTGAILLPRIMVRLLQTLTQDRKTNLGNWQLTLRRQYARREPMNDPLAPLPDSRSPSPESSPPPEPAPSNTPESVPKKDPSTRGSSIDARIEDTVSSPVPPTRELSESKDERETPSGGNVSTERASAAHPQTSGFEETRPQDWLDLPMLSKLDSLHTVAEWQFHNVNRFRSTMKSDDDYASWRIEPIGYDSKANAYWLIAEDRLWIQRQPPSTRNTRKRKRPAKKSAPERQRKRAAVDASSRRGGMEPVASGSGSRTRSAPSKTIERPSAPSRTSSRTRSTGATSGPRAAKLQANVKLGEQAKQLAALQRQASLEAKTHRPTGTRQSSRLRGAELDEDDWQQVPQDWLGGKGNESGRASNRNGIRNARRSTRSTVKASAVVRDTVKQAKASIGLDSDEESDLTELSDDDEQSGSDTEDLSVDDVVAEDAVIESSEEDAPQSLPDNFVEWETVCVTLQEWESIADRFKDSNHYLEKALYKVLANNIVPVIAEQLREIEKSKRLEEALYSRKRSSRLAVKETQKEEARSAAMKRVEEEKELGRARRAEARHKKEEDEREKREKAREQRRLDREAKEEQARLKAEGDTRNSSVDVDVVGTPDTSSTQPNLSSKSKRQSHSATARVTTSGRAADRWDLDCEGCGRKGSNLDDGTPMIACIRCTKRQHATCQDALDRSAGRPPRNWRRDHFVCSKCRAAAMPVRSGSNPKPVEMTQPTSNGRGGEYGQISLQLPRQPNPASHPSPQVQPYGWSPTSQYPQTGHYSNTGMQGIHVQGTYPSASHMPHGMNPLAPGSVPARHGTTLPAMNGRLQHPTSYSPAGAPYYHDPRVYANAASPSMQPYPSPIQTPQVAPSASHTSVPYPIDARGSMSGMQGYGQMNGHPSGAYMGDPHSMNKASASYSIQSPANPDMFVHMTPGQMNGTAGVNANQQAHWQNPMLQQQYGHYPGYDTSSYAPQAHFPS